MPKFGLRLRGRSRSSASSSSTASSSASKKTSSRESSPPIDQLVIHPTNAEYAAHAGKEFLIILESVAHMVPIPGFGPAVKVAVNIMKTCDETHGTIEYAQELKFRIKKLVVVLVDELKGKNVLDISPKILKDIRTLSKDMTYIDGKLGELVSQNFFRIVFFKSLHEETIRKCITRLETSLISFTLAREIEHADMLARLEQKITMFYAPLGNLQITMDGVKAMLEDRLPPRNPSPPPSPLRSIMPANTVSFHGREIIVSELIGVLTGPSRQHICLTGPGGMGKTSTSLATMSHPDIQTHFPDHLRVWVPCVKAPSLSLFVGTLHTSLGIPNKSGNPISDILSELKISPPIVLVLDNFETTWNAESGQSEVERVLRCIHQLPHVTLFITMRSSSPPCGDLPWHHVNLQAVDASAAQSIYTSWHPEGGDDPGLPRLLALIGNMPLAVMLLAKVAKLTHLSAEELMEEYNKVGTPMLGQGLDAESSMDVCIGLSVYSPRMEAHPDAFQLLCILSMLPVGTSYRMLSKWWARGLPNLTGALEVLKSTSLIEARGSTFFVLPVIQRYILHPSRHPSHVRTSTIDSACAFLDQHTSRFGDPNYKTHVASLSSEDGNLQAVLLSAKARDPRTIRGLLLLARHQRDHRPRIDVIDHAITLAAGIEDKSLHGDLFFCRGDMLDCLHQFDGAVKDLQRALSLYLAGGHRRKSAECRLKLAEVLNSHPDSNFVMEEQNIVQAQADCEKIGDRSLIGLYLLALGSLHYTYKRQSTALSFLSQAELVFVEVNDQFQHAECSQALSWVYYSTGDYDAAHRCAESAFDECASIGNVQGCSQIALDIGLILSADGDHEGSLRATHRCLEIRNTMGLPPLGDALQLLGLGWGRLGRTADAWRALDESLREYASEEPTQESTRGSIRSRFLLKRLKDLAAKPDPKEYLAMCSWYSEDHLNKILSS